MTVQTAVQTAVTMHRIPKEHMAKTIFFVRHGGNSALTVISWSNIYLLLSLIKEAKSACSLRITPSCVFR